MADIKNTVEETAEAAANQKKQKVLISVRNLKQYFPVKNSKNLFVKANDGISLDIYEGETLGVVGESGCGKSTLGRVLLQLYHQTEGETMYYGRSIASLAPEYVMDIYKNLGSKCKEVLELEQKYSKLEEEYKKLEDAASPNAGEDVESKLFKALDDMNKAKKEFENARLNICELVGGFYTLKDHTKISELYVGYYDEVIKRFKMNRELEATLLDMKDTEAKIKEGISAGSLGKKASDLKNKAEVQEKALHDQDQVIQGKYDLIEDYRKTYIGQPEFDEYEKYRDEGLNLARLSYNEMRTLRQDIQLIFQDPYSSLNPRMTVGQIIGEGLLTHKFYKSSNEAMQEHIMKTMEECGLAPYMIHRYPHQFSGGQRQRIGIARSLAVNPKFVVCDEAVSALDVSIQSQIINLLKDLKEQENLTYMFISHDLSVVKYISDRIAVMYLGNIVELAASQEIFENPLHPYTESLLLAIPTTDPDQSKELVILEGDIPSPVNPPSGCKFHTRCRYCMDICKEVTPEFIEISKDHFVACHYRENRG